VLSPEIDLALPRTLSGWTGQHQFRWLDKDFGKVTSFGCVIAQGSYATVGIEELSVRLCFTSKDAGKMTFIDPS
jgi:hypothetical protein